MEPEKLPEDVDKVTLLDVALALVGDALKQHDEDPEGAAWWVAVGRQVRSDRNGRPGKMRQAEEERDAAREELAHIDSILAGRPALAEKETRAEKIEYALREAGRQSNRANKAELEAQQQAPKIVDTTPTLPRIEDTTQTLPRVDPETVAPRPAGWTCQDPQT